MDSHFPTHPMRMSGDMNMNTSLPTIPHVINILILDLVSFRSNALSLFTQTAYAAPMRRTTILPILVTIRDIFVELLNAVDTAWKESYLFIKQCYRIMGLEQPEEFHQGERHLHALRKSHIQARQIQPFSGRVLDKAEELLISELRGSRSVEHVLRFTKRFFELSSYRVDIMENLPRRMNMIRRDVSEIMDCLYYLEEQMSRIKILLWDPEWRACVERQDVMDLLFGACCSDLSLRQSMVGDWIRCLYRYGSREIPIDSVHQPAQGRDRDMRSWWNLLSERWRAHMERQ
ncbi:uncharacterized protein EV420DRAFT_1557951 [Desarmillaria tabescens]|uniref:Uncharacterized protein n=1 Tax=Armillaria tabescens TaxID=1929756 RepID=A0AA39K1Y2_ARMTA|nr:uncharacterized protein EV420DRAFT_1557951 [Desarmillaria tabescens]KAK0452999.1 hypothetical protein EV420DRAFT_1557951 [Desarmillaria tabescens]